ncbi:non-specific serine/threonine protein kinase [Caenorhabditis elegans]|uniref:non-specific serine/threonine protein kinase n=1 Tax=Caenorhabditis elegans TaxID=6239 RepID=H9G331_CAEEL|nr:non-specific serine/threonine protein kinase [Caenorhabditis elegans]CCG28214.1 non-specific serine/threonine protein kinase [Caenorhabditis elegans]|eukprot:NP_001255556.1 protein KINase [Caenorhabditis elegans]
MLNFGVVMYQKKSPSNATEKPKSYLHPYRRFSMQPTSTYRTSLSPQRSPRLKRLSEQLSQIRISLDPPSPPFLSPSPLGDYRVNDEPRMHYLQVPGGQADDNSPEFRGGGAFLFGNNLPSRFLSSPPPDRRTSFASTMSDTNSSITIPMSSSYQNLLSPMWSTMKYSSDDNETPPNEPSPRRSKSALSNRSSSDCINVPPIVFSPVLSRPIRSMSPTMSMSPTFRTHHNSDSESDTGAQAAGVCLFACTSSASGLVWKGSGSLMIPPRRSFHRPQGGGGNDSSDSNSNVERLLKRNRRRTMAIHGVETEPGQTAASTGWTSASMTNLCRVRSSLGHSDPQLSSSSTNSFNTSTSSLHPATKSSTTALSSFSTSSANRSPANRPSLHSSTSPVTLQRCRSPMRVPQRSTSSSHNFGAAGAGPSSSGSSVHSGTITLRTYSARNGSSLMAPVQDTRRWSLASLPSTSGYGTPGTGSNSGVSSQYSSSEQIGEMLDQTRISGPVRQNSSRFDSNDSYDDMASHQQAAAQNAFLNRPRSRSLTSPMKFLNEYNIEMVNRTSVYKERFPRAKLQMEERLNAFVAENGPLSGGISQQSARDDTDRVDDLSARQSGSSSGLKAKDSVEEAVMRSRRSTVLEAESYADRSLLRLIGDGATRFLHHQIVEIALDCLGKSKDDLITCSYFCEMSQRLEETLNEAQMKTSPESLEYLSKLVKKLLMIVSRPARLLECLEFDPDEFYHLLEEAEGVVREQLGSGTARVPDLPQYIIGKLGLDRDPLIDSTEHVDSSENTHATTSGTTSAKGAGSAWQETNRAPCEDDFDTIRLVSNGAYGAVYLVRHRETRQRFALKKMNKQTLMLRNQVDQVFAERDILTMADNPFVVSFYGSFETRQYLCMLMEYVEGGDCAALLKSAGTLPVELVRLYVAETILAIEYLHSYGIVHRDLKPDNLLITAMGHIKLTDFGLSKIGLMNRTTLVAEGYDAVVETQQFQDKQLCGTPEYIAPEVILRRGYGKPVDWWALGIILYEFLVGIVPFFGETPEALFSKVISEDVEYPEEDEALPPEAADLCRRLLEKNPAERLGTLNGAAQLMAHEFFILLDFTSLLRQKAEFVPQLDNEEDTSYFDTRTDRYNHEAESCGEEEIVGSSAASSMMFHSFSTASPRHSIVSIDPAHLPHLLSTANAAAKEIERSHSVSMSSRPETRPERSYSTGQAPPELFKVGDDNTSTAVNLRRRFSAQRHNVSTTSSSGTGSGTCFATAASSTDSSIDASSLPLFQPPSRSSIAERGSRSPLPKFSISCEGEAGVSRSGDDHDDLDDSRNSTIVSTASSGGADETVRFRRQSSGRTPASQLQLVIPSISSSQSSQSAEPARETCYVMYPSGPSTSVGSQLSPGGASVSSASSSNDVGSPHPLPLHHEHPLTSHDSSAASSSTAPSKTITIRKGPFGFGFTLKSVRVYLGEHSEYYTIEHIVTAVVEGSPAFHANLQAEDMITHVNGHPVHNLTHPQLMHRLLANGNELILRLVPLANTSIREGAARRTVGKMARKKPKRPQRRVVPLEKKTRKPSALLRRLSGKRATNDIVPGSSSQKQAFMPRSASSQDGCILTHLPGTSKISQQEASQEPSTSSQGMVRRSVNEIEKSIAISSSPSSRVEFIHNTARRRCNSGNLVVSKQQRLRPRSDFF